MLEIPLRLFGYSIGNVFAQKSAEAINISESYFREISRRLLYKLLLVGIPSFAFLTVFGDLIFSFVFGDDWKMAGIFAGLMAVYYSLFLCTTTLNPIFYVLKKEHLFMTMQLSVFVTRLTVFLASSYFDWNTKYLFVIYCLANTLVYFVLLCILLHLLQQRVWATALYIIAAIVTSVFIFALVRYWIFGDHLVIVWIQNLN
jgi:O-antigen/teichoic acid export membrane protein